MTTPRSGLPGDPEQTFVMPSATRNAPPARVMPDPPTWTIVAEATQAAAYADLPSVTVESGSAVAYRMRKQIGHGAMGEVWEAEQTSLGRVIAVKRLRRKPDRKDAEERSREIEFRSESTIAASLEHPNILPVYDLGRDAAGNLLLAMKRVHGTPWEDSLRTDFAGMPVDAYLARHIPILMSVTQAVAFAHSRGVIHRDLKPSQVLVGAFGEILLTDWGLAIQMDAVGHPALPATLRSWTFTPDTATNPAGTPAMMAPEQTETHGGNLGPWTDVYLLGGILYYLLTGCYPHAADSSEAAFGLARTGHVPPPKSRIPDRVMPPDLEQLCLKALQPERAERLASAADFLHGLEDFQSGTARKRKSTELVAAVNDLLQQDAPDQARYTRAIAALEEARRLWPDNPDVGGRRQHALNASARLALIQGDLSFARLQCDAMDASEDTTALRGEIAVRQRRVARRRSLLRLATAAVFVLLIVIAAGALLFSRRMQNANAEIAQREQAAEHALKIAKARGNGAFSLINYVLDDLKEAMDQQLTPERGVTFDNRNAISQAIAGKVASPVVKYFNAAKPDSWPRDMQLAQATEMLDVGKHFIEMARFDEARKLLLSALATREKLLGKQSVDVADVLAALAVVYREKGKFKQADTMLHRAIAIGERQRGADDPKTIGYVLALADLYGATRTNKKQLHEAEALYDRAVTVLKKRHDAKLAMALAHQGRVLDYLDKPEQAEAVLRHALAVWKTTHAPDDPGPADILNSLAGSILNQNRDLNHIDQKQIVQAIALLRRAAALRSTKLGPGNPLVLDTQSTLAGALATAGHTQNAAVLYRKVIVGFKAAYGAESYRTGRQILSFGFFLTHQKQYKEAEDVLRHATNVLQKTLGPDSLEVGWGYTFLGFVYQRTHRLPQAKVALERAIKILKVRRGPDNFETRKAEQALAEVESAMAAARK